VKSGILIVFLAAVFVPPQDAKKEYEEKREALAASKDPDAFATLGEWCVEKSLKDGAQWCFKKAHDLSKGHAGALAGMRKLGWTLEKDVWRTARDVYDKRRRATLRDDLDARFAVAQFARDYGLEKDWKRDCEELVKLAPEYRPAREAMGFASYYGEWLLAPELEKAHAQDAAWDAAIAAKRAPEAALEELKAAGYKGTVQDVRKILTLADAPRKGHQRVKLGLQADKFPGEYSYGIPSTYKPWRKSPMIVFLHGGGPGVGDGDQYFPQIWPYSGHRGYITVCPTVLQKVQLAWDNDQHVDFIRTIVQEMQSKYTIDPRRVYLMGHSMGGFGCFYVGTRTTDLFAAISPWSGGPVGWISRNLKNTPTYIIHGDADVQVSVEGSRMAAKELAQLKYPHTYIELPGVGHGIPGPEQQKAVDWLERWLLSPAAAVPPRK
jgi:predicted esterase